MAFTNMENGEINNYDEFDIEDDSNVGATRKGTLSKFIRSKTDLRITSDSKDLLMAYLDQLTILLIKRASEECERDGKQTISPKHLEVAYEELMRPHVFVDCILETLENQKDQLKEVAKSSLIRYMEVD